MLLAIDVDLTVVDTLTPWLDWFESGTGYKVLNENKSYDLLPEMNKLLRKSHRECTERVTIKHPFDFWKQHGLYDGLEPIQGSIDALKSLFDLGNRIIFVSSCVPEHINSKMRFINKYFPFHEGFIDTHDKHFIAYDALIDDKMEHMKMGTLHRPNSKHILFTGCRVDSGCSGGFETLNSWDNTALNLVFN